MLAPDSDAITTQLTADHAVNNYLMAWSHRLLNTSLYPVDPKPAWFDKISEPLTTAKGATQTWLNEKFPDIAAGLPQALIDYGNTFRSKTSELQPLLEKATLSAQERNRLIAHIDDLSTEARQQQWLVRGYQTKVKEFAKLVTGVAAKMETDVMAVTKSLDTAQREAVALQNRIGELQNQLGITTTEAKNHMSSAAMTGGTISLTMVSLAVMTAVGTAAIPVFGIAGAVIGIGINAALEASRSAAAVQIIREIGELTQKLTRQQYQVAALRSINHAMEQLSDVATTALTNMAGSVHHWDDIVGNLAAAREILDQPAIDLRKITAYNTWADAHASWKTIIDRAGNIQRSVLKVEKTIELVVGGSAA
jgi:Bacillus haemolytic enterotoxin (HBL)